MTAIDTKIEAPAAGEVGLRAMLREDARVNQSRLRPGYHAMVMYRLGRWAAQGSKYRRPFLALAYVLRLFVRNFYGIELYWEASIGRRFCIGHQGAIVIHKYCTIGDDCVIRQGCTIGVTVSEDHFGPETAPQLGHNVDIGAGAVIVGKVRIGNNVRIGPNAVVSTDVPDNSTVLSPASRIVSWG